MRLPAELAPLILALDRRPAPTLLWWRDDDAGASDPRLDRLLSVARNLDAPVALAVVPAWLEAPTTAAIRATAQASVLQHGWAHADHAAPGERRIELGGTADRARLADELGRGTRRLAQAFGGRFLPVLVPPWNRIARDLLGYLPGLGFRALSVWDEGDLGALPPGLARLDVHVDPIDWRGGGRWLGLPAIASRLELCLARRDGPIGLVTHHRVQDEAAWRDLETLLAVLRGHPNVRLMSAASLLGGAG